MIEFTLNGIKYRCSFQSCGTPHSFKRFVPATGLWITIRPSNVMTRAAREAKASNDSSQQVAA